MIITHHLFLLSSNTPDLKQMLPHISVVSTLLHGGRVGVTEPCEIFKNTLLHRKRYAVSVISPSVAAHVMQTDNSSRGCKTDS